MPNDIYSVGKLKNTQGEQLWKADIQQQEELFTVAIYFKPFKLRSGNGLWASEADYECPLYDKGVFSEKFKW